MESSSNNNAMLDDREFDVDRFIYFQILKTGGPDDVDIGYSKIAQSRDRKTAKEIDELVREIMTKPVSTWRLPRDAAVIKPGRTLLPLSIESPMKKTFFLFHLDVRGHGFSRSEPPFESTHAGIYSNCRLYRLAGDGIEIINPADKPAPYPACEWASFLYDGETASGQGKVDEFVHPFWCNTTLSEKTISDPEGIVTGSGDTGHPGGAGGG